MNDSAPLVRVIEGRGSWRSRALSALLRLTSRRTLLQDTDIPALRRRYEGIEARHFPVESWVLRDPVDCDGVSAEWVGVPNTRPGRVLLYLHGGSFAFRFPNIYAAFAARLCRRFEARALIPDYRLAPEHPFPAAPDDCHTAYRWLLASGHDPREIVLIGDSAGAVLLSPAVDCTLTSPSMVDNEELDPVLHLRSLLVLRHHYAPSPQLYMHPEVSPIFADFTGYPPLFLQAGSSEMLRDEAIRTAQRANAAGVHVELELWPETLHVFQVASFLPESAQALDHIVRFVREHTGWRTTNPAQ